MWLCSAQLVLLVTKDPVQNFWSIFGFGFKIKNLLIIKASLASTKVLAGAMAKADQ